MSTILHHLLRCRGPLEHLQLGLPALQHQKRTRSQLLGQLDSVMTLFDGAPQPHRQVVGTPGPGGALLGTLLAALTLLSFADSCRSFDWIAIRKQLITGYGSILPQVVTVAPLPSRSFSLRTKPCQPPGPWTGVVRVESLHIDLTHALLHRSPRAFLQLSITFARKRNPRKRFHARLFVSFSNYPKLVPLLSRHWPAVSLIQTHVKVTSKSLQYHVSLFVIIEAILYLNNSSSFSISNTTTQDLGTS